MTIVLGEADGQWGFLDFLFEQILFVQEENDRCLREPFVVANRVKELQWFVLPILNNFINIPPF